MSFIVIIPARYASTRLPGKPLLDIAGRSMIHRVYLCAKKSSASRVVVATDDQRIVDEVHSFGGEACMTLPVHQSGTDRLEEVVTKLKLSDENIVVNVQGDEPLIPPEVIDQVAESLLNHKDASASTLCEPITSGDTFFNPNVVKVVADNEGHAMYFSRAPIPWDRDNLRNNQKLFVNNNLAQRHIGVYGYRVKLLHQFVNWEMAPLEKIEKLEQLRILANGKKIIVQQACNVVPGGVDTVEDLERVRTLFGSSRRFNNSQENQDGV